MSFPDQRFASGATLRTPLRHAGAPGDLRAEPRAANQAEFEPGGWLADRVAPAPAAAPELRFPLGYVTPGSTPRRGVGGVAPFPRLRSQSAEPLAAGYAAGSFTAPCGAVCSGGYRLPPSTPLSHCRGAPLPPEYGSARRVAGYASAVHGESECLRQPRVCVRFCCNQLFQGDLTPVKMFCTAFDVPCTEIFLARGSAEHAEWLKALYDANARRRWEIFDFFVAVDNELFTSVVQALCRLSVALRQPTSQLEYTTLLDFADALCDWRAAQRTLESALARKLDAVALLKDYFAARKPAIYERCNALLANDFAFVAGRHITWVDFLLAGYIYNDFMLDEQFPAQLTDAGAAKTQTLNKQYANLGRFWVYFCGICKPVNKWMVDRDAELAATLNGFDNRADAPSKRC